MSAARAMMQDDGALDLRPFADALDMTVRAGGVAERLQARREAAGATADLDGVVVTGADLAFVRQTEAAMGAVEKGARGAPKERARLGARISALGLRLTAAHDARAAERRLVETTHLDASREGVRIEAVIERQRGVRYLRLTTRDGLKLLHERDAFTPRDAQGEVRKDLEAVNEAALLLAVGLRYRELYERAGPRLKSSLSIDGAPVREQRTFEREVKAAHRRAAQSGVLRKWEAKVARRLGDDALLALRAVAGEAKTISSVESGRRRQRRLTALLTAALTLLTDEVVKGA